MLVSYDKLLTADLVPKLSLWHLVWLFTSRYDYIMVHITDLTLLQGCHHLDREENKMQTVADTNSRVWNFGNLYLGGVGGILHKLVASEQAELQYQHIRLVLLDKFLN